MLSMPPATPASEVAGADRLIDQPDRADPRRADLVDRLGGDLLGDPALDLGLARGDLALAGLQHLPIDDLLDLSGLDVGALEGAADRLAAEVGGVERARAPPILPNGVRAAPRITVFGIRGVPLVGRWRGCRGIVEAAARCASSGGSSACLGGRDRSSDYRAPRCVSSSATPTPLDRRRHALRRPVRRRGTAGLARPPPSGIRRRPRGAGAFKKLTVLRPGPAATACSSSGSASATSSTPSGPGSRPRSPSGRPVRSMQARSPGPFPSIADRRASAAALTEGTVLAAYRFDRYKRDGNDDGDTGTAIATLTPARSRRPRRLRGDRPRRRRGRRTGARPAEPARQRR